MGGCKPRIDGTMNIKVLYNLEYQFTVWGGGQIFEPKHSQCF